MFKSWNYITSPRKAQLPFHLSDNGCLFFPFSWYLDGFCFLHSWTVTLSGRVCSKIKEVKRRQFFNFQVQIKISKISFGVIFFWFFSSLLYQWTPRVHRHLNLAHLNLDKWVVVGSRWDVTAWMSERHRCHLEYRDIHLLSLWRISWYKNMEVFRNPTVFLMRLPCQGRVKNHLSYIL